MAKSIKRTKKTAYPTTPRKSPGADASIAEVMGYPDESRSEVNCVGALQLKPITLYSTLPLYHVIIIFDTVLGQKRNIEDEN